MLDLLIRGGLVLDGSGDRPQAADIAVRQGWIVDVAPSIEGTAVTTLEAGGLAVAPGFINSVSWAGSDLAKDGRAFSDLTQGVTLEVLGEGESLGPCANGACRTTLAMALDRLAEQGLAVNIASFIGATTVRTSILGEEARPPTPSELDRMRALVTEAVEDGALGLGASPYSVPGAFAEQGELQALARAAAAAGGTLICHPRRIDQRLPEAVAEGCALAEAAGCAVDLCNFKAARTTAREAWSRARDLIEIARDRGVQLSATTYPYTRARTTLAACLPAWCLNGGIEALRRHAGKPASRARILEETRIGRGDWRGFFTLAGADGVFLPEHGGDALAAVAAAGGADPAELLLEAMLEDPDQLAQFELVDEAVLRDQLRVSWMGVASDDGAYTTGVGGEAHPRAFGTFARLLSRSFRNSVGLALEDAVRRITRLPADRLGLRDRGRIEVGAIADLVVFDADDIRDRASYAKPDRYSEGILHVFVAGRQAIADGRFTGVHAGRVVIRA